MGEYISKKLNISLSDNNKKLIEKTLNKISEEVLKQPQYSPLPVEKQVVIIYAGANGFLDDIEAGEVTRFESELYPFVEAKYPEILEQIRDKKKLDKDIEDLLSKALNEFKATFAAK